VIFHRHWQALRRHAGYRDAVQICLQEIETFTAGACAQLDALEQASATSGTMDHVARAGTARTLAAQCMASHVWLRELAALERTLHSGVFPVDRMQTIPKQHRDLYNATWRQLMYLCHTETRALIAPLGPFVAAWNIRVPLDPTIVVLPSFVGLHVWETAYAIEVCSPPANDEMVLTLHVRPGATRDALLALVDAALQTHVPPEWMARPGRQQLDRAYYDELFEVYDRHMAGAAPREIAQALWPKELAADAPRYPASPHHHPTVQRVRDLVRAAKKIIKNVPRKK
jgi:hypothetical protein